MHRRHAEEDARAILHPDAPITPKMMKDSAGLDLN
jgi:hypothetical protein